MGKTWHDKNSAEVTEDLDNTYRILINKIENDEKIVFADDTYDKLAFFTFHCLKMEHFNIDNIKKLKTIASEYMVNLNIEMADLDNEAKEITKTIINDSKLINDLTSEFFLRCDRNSGLSKRHYSILKPTISNIILKNSFKNKAITNQFLIKDFSSELRKFGNISPDEFDAIYDFISVQKCTDTLKYVIKRARKEEIKNKDLNNIEDEVNILNGTHLEVTKEILKVAEITDICEYLINSDNPKPVKSIEEKNRAMKLIIANWANNIAHEKTSLGSLNYNIFKDKKNKILMSDYTEDNQQDFILDDETREIGMKYAKELHSLTKAIKKHLKIDLNDSGVEFRDINNSDNDLDLLNYTHSIQENIENEIQDIAMSAEYTEYDNIFNETISILNKKNNIDVSSNDLSIIYDSIKNRHPSEVEFQNKKLNMMTILLIRDHKHITEARLSDSIRENLAKKKKDNTTGEQIDFLVTKNQIIPSITGEKGTLVQIDKYLNTKDKLTSNIYYSYTKSLKDYHRKFKSKDGSFYESGYKYLFSLRKSKLQNLLLIKTKEMKDQNNSQFSNRYFVKPNNQR